MSDTQAPGQDPCSDDFDSVLTAEINRVKKDSFVDGYDASVPEALGLILSRYFRWDGIDIMKTAENALEDANFHTACGKLAEIRANEEKEF